MPALEAVSLNILLFIGTWYFYPELSFAINQNNFRQVCCTRSLGVSSLAAFDLHWKNWRSKNYWERKKMFGKYWEVTVSQTPLRMLFLNWEWEKTLTSFGGEVVLWVFSCLLSRHLWHRGVSELWTVISCRIRCCSSWTSTLREMLGVFLKLCSLTWICKMTGK